MWLQVLLRHALRPCCYAFVPECPEHQTKAPAELRPLYSLRQRAPPCCTVKVKYAVQSVSWPDARMLCSCALSTNMNYITALQPCSSHTYAHTMVVPEQSAQWPSNFYKWSIVILCVHSYCSHYHASIVGKFLRSCAEFAPIILLHLH